MCSDVAARFERLGILQGETRARRRCAAPARQKKGNAQEDQKNLPLPPDLLISL
jgi:hypothetical protein